RSSGPTTRATPPRATRHARTRGDPSRGRAMGCTTGGTRGSCLFPLARVGRAKILQDRPHALSPALLVVLAAARLDVHQVLGDGPAFRDERVAQRAHVGDDLLPFSR